MSATFFYSLGFEYYKLAYESYYKVTARVNSLINTVFSILALIIGLCYFVIKENLSGHILLYSGFSIFFYYH